MKPNPERLLLRLKSEGACSAADLAEHLGVTAPAVRQHMARFLEEGLVLAEDRPGGRGRPVRYYRLTAAGHARFPDRHAAVTVELIEATRGVFGAEGLDRLVRHMATVSEAVYTTALEAIPQVEGRLNRLAEIRSEEGYMALVEPHPDGGWLFVENHCPICAAAAACQGFCRSELSVFRAALGPAVAVERTEHILAGARRCAYRIRPRDGSSDASA